ncbi:hypothetical protein PGT21_024192 [Puccinia graminis f. sp. tritici]|uniref:Uncharacterized protein n=1 Tax=Puccinia graminis f. sp. tritici TaxID=56615 RepID=A0A5B0LKD9_PUCGR|nr:hypothetical protein PGT21_024192 [Puccinia graminis f. sp. tritici]
MAATTIFLTRILRHSSRLIINQSLLCSLSSTSTTTTTTTTTTTCAILSDESTKSIQTIKKDIKPIEEKVQKTKPSKAKNKAEDVKSSEQETKELPPDKTDSSESLTRPKDGGDKAAGRRGCTAYNLVDLEGILPAGEVVQPRRPGGSPPGRRGCTTSSTKRIPSWPARSYSLADQEGVLLVDEVVQPRRPGGFPPRPARLYRRPGGIPPGRRDPCLGPMGGRLACRRARQSAPGVQFGVRKGGWLAFINPLTLETGADTTCL